MEATGTELWITGSTLRADAKVAQHWCASSAPASTECPSLQSGLGNNSTFSVECLACILVPCSFSLAHKGPFSIWRLIIPTFCKRLKAKGNQGHKFRCNRRGHRLKPKGLSFRNPGFIEQICFYYLQSRSLPNLDKNPFCASSPWFQQSPPPFQPFPAFCARLQHIWVPVSKKNIFLNPRWKQASASKVSTNPPPNSLLSPELFCPVGVPHRD